MPSSPTKVSPKSDASVELRLIPEFGGSPSESVAEWLEKVQLVCDLRCIDKPETLVPLWLTGGAFAVYQQLSASDKRDFSKLKEALLVAFGADSFAAYEQLTTRRGCDRPGETVDVTSSSLNCGKLALLFVGLPWRPPDWRSCFTLLIFSSCAKCEGCAEMTKASKGAKKESERLFQVIVMMTSRLFFYLLP